MKHKTLLMAIALGAITTHLMAIDPPQNVKDYLQVGTITEFGVLSDLEGNGKAFVEYIAPNWNAVLTGLATVAPTAKQQRLVVAAIEFVQGRDYLSALNKLCDLKAAGSLSDEVVDFAIRGTRIKKGFLSYNFQDTQTRQLIQRVQTLLPANSSTQPLLADILSGAQKTKDKDYFEFNDLPEPTPLPAP